MHELACLCDIGSRRMSITECQCSEAGFCSFLRRECDPQAGRYMHPVRHDQCKNKLHYFEMFLDETRKPCHTTGPQKAPESDWGQSPCLHLGPEVDSVFCESCGGTSIEYPVRECAIYGLCTEHHR